MSDYQPTAWVDGGDPAITAAELNRIDQGVKTALDGNDANANAARAAQQRADKGVQDAATAQTAAKKAQATADQAVQDAKRAQETADKGARTAAAAQETANAAARTTRDLEPRVQTAERAITELTEQIGGGTFSAGIPVFWAGQQLKNPVIHMSAVKVESSRKITFPITFKNPPVVLTQVTDGNNASSIVRVVNSSITTTGCTINVYAGHGGAGTATLFYLLVGEAS